MFVDDVVGVELPATTLAGKHIATVLQNFVLVKHLQRLESFVTDITGVSPSSLLGFFPHTDPIQQQHDHPHKPALYTCRSSCKQMSTPIHVLLKAYLCLEDNGADDKADPSVCLQLKQIYVLQYLLETAGSMDHQRKLRQTVFVKEVFATVVALFLQTGKGGEWQVIWCLRRPQKFLILGLWVSLQCGCLTSYW